MKQEALDRPRWQGGPQICRHENLMAFQTQAAIRQFVEANCPHANITREWECPRCGGWHYRSASKDRAQLPEGFKVHAPVPPRPSHSTSQSELPKRKAEKPLDLPKERPKPTQRSLL